MSHFKTSVNDYRITPQPVLTVHLYRIFNKQNDLTYMPTSESGHLIILKPKRAIPRKKKTFKFSSNCNINITGISNLPAQFICSNRNALSKVAPYYMK